MKTIPRVSAKHYGLVQPRTAKVRFRIKGETDGPIYQGQTKIKACQSCGQSRIKAISNSITDLQIN